MLMIAVCDDEIRACLHLSKQIRTILEELNVPFTIKQYNNGQQLLQDADEFDIIFLDVIMCGMDGMKTAELLRHNFSDNLLRCVSKITRQSDDFIIISKGRQTRKLFLDEIRYFEIHGRLIEAHGIHPTFSWYEQIGTLETALSDKDFVRCHKSYLINLKYVEVYNRQEATLDNGEKILIAKRRYESFCTAILEYMRKNGGLTTL